MEATPAQVAALVDLLPAPCVVALDAQGRDVRVNQAFRRSLGPSGRFRYMRDGRELQLDELPFMRAIANDAHIPETEIDVALEDGNVLRFVGCADPLRDKDGTTCGAVATFVNLTQAYHRQREEQRSTRSELDLARQTERRTTDRIRYLAQVGEELAESLDLHALFERLGGVLVPCFADCIILTMRDEANEVRTTFVYDGKPEQGERHWQMREHLLGTRLPVSMNVISDGVATYTNDLSNLLAESADDNYNRYVRWLIDELGYVRMINVPMRNRGRVVGAMAVLGRTDRLYSDEDAHMLEEIARRAASAIDNARSFEHARHVAETLQQALLPTRLPELNELTFNALYAPSDDKARVGGDWYDAVELPDGRVVVSIGDVTGRGIEAAVIMGKVRQAIGTLALADPNPSHILAAADFELRRFYPDAIVTAFVGTLDPRGGTLWYATAGHPPPYLVTSDGVVVPLPGHGLPLGLRSDQEPPPATLHLQQNAHVVFYTDGLLESTRNVDEGERRVIAALRDFHSRAQPLTAAALCDRVLFDGSNDDVAVMIARVVEAPVRTLHWQFDAADMRFSRELRGTLLRYLRECAREGSDISGAELVVGELIGNIVRHAPGIVDVELDWLGEHPILQIVDRGEGYSARSWLPSDPLSEYGRGLYLINELAKEFRVTRLPGYGSHSRTVLRLSRP